MKAFPFFLILFSILTTISCTTETRVSESFNNINDRHWVGKNYWSIPLEDWKVKNGELHCIGTVPNSRVNLLTHVLAPGSGGFVVTSKIGLTNEGTIPGSAGLWIGVHDKEDPDVRAACYFGKGIQAGISLQGFAFLRDQRVELPAGFDFHDVTLTITGNDKGLKMKVVDKSGKSPDELTCDADGIQGIIAMVNNFNLGRNQKPGNSTFCFDDFKLSGSKVVHQPDNSFGPILWTMYTLNEGTVKLMVLLPPVGNDDNQAVHLQLKKDNTWETVATEEIDPDSRTAVFRLSDWDHSSTVDYRVEYIETGKNGTRMPEYFEGTIRQEPVDRPLTLGGLTCQFHYGFPYTPLVKNLNALNPDMLYFSGDQIYEANGGYPVKREPADVSIINYLGKYYMFGWAFRDLMRDRPTICTPDDHDVFHGNLWGDGGTSKPEGVVNDDTQGFSQSVKMVNVVNQTNCGQLPDPYDPTPIKQGMSVWYTSLTYGRVSFAIISDRIFKTGPEVVSDWGGRKDHMKEPREDLSFLDQSGVEMIGDRQMHFLHEWIRDWEDADMKVLLSQTVFANIATHHGNREGYLYGDLDSGGWPKSGRDKIIKLMRKAAVFHINGDQHVPSLSQYGLHEHRDAGWSFCTPAITVGYQRWFLPDELGIPVIDRPDHGYPNTGKYTDAFGNKNFVYAIGNPGRITTDNESRYNQALIRSSGFGIVTFDPAERTINMDAWRFKADVENPNPVRDQFPGWPLKISQSDNLGTTAQHMLPEITVNKPNQLLQIWNEQSNELEQICRIKGTVMQPKLHEAGTYTIIIGEGKNKKAVTNQPSQIDKNPEKITLEI